MGGSPRGCAEPRQVRQLGHQSAATRQVRRQDIHHFRLGKEILSEILQLNILLQIVSIFQVSNTN